MVKKEPCSLHSSCDHVTHELEVSNLHVHYGKICAVHDVSFATSCGTAVALVGPNGAGKSTLLKALAGLMPAHTGTAMWKGKAVGTSNHEIAYLPQREEIDWSFPITVKGLVEMGRFPKLGLFNKFSDEDEAKVLEALQSMQLNGLESRQISALSGGQQQRAFIARALAQEAHVLLLDEPFAGLDPVSTKQLAGIIRKLSGEHRLIIASHHDLLTTKDIFDEVLLMKREGVAFGTAETILTDEAIQKVFYE